jgi:hypothetical protein
MHTPLAPQKPKYNAREGQGHEGHKRKLDQKPHAKRNPQHHQSLTQRNGVPMEFFHDYAKEVAPTLLKAVTAMLNSKKTSASINKGLITLIPKTRDHAKLSN